MGFGCLKELLIEMVLLSTNSIMLDLRNNKILKTYFNQKTTMRYPGDHHVLPLKVGTLHERKILLKKKPECKGLFSKPNR